MKKKLIIIPSVILIILIIGSFITLFYIFGSLEKEISFSYTISVSNFDFAYEQYLEKNETSPEENPENFNEIIIDKHKVIISQIFAKSTPCTSINYTVNKENNIISIIPHQIITKGGCISVIAFDEVEINLTLKDGIYTLKIYEFWNQNTPFIIKSILIGNQNCAKEGEKFSPGNQNETIQKCCNGLTEVGCGGIGEQSISISDKCYWRGATGCANGMVCINCGNGICEEIESVCTCSQDCVGKNKSDYTLNEFCEKEWKGKYEELCKEEFMKNELICKLCV